MKSYKNIAVFIMATVLLVTQISVASAGPPLQDGTLVEGNVESVVIETNTETGEAEGVVVSIKDKSGVTQTFNLSPDYATSLGLVVDDGAGGYAVAEGVVGLPVFIDPNAAVLAEEEKEHPVGSALSEFFYDMLGVDYEKVMEYHEDGMGFGVIAQALWMTNALDGDTITFEAILDAKKNHDFSAITLPDGSTPKNWGQFRKAVMSDREKSKENLGSVMSGRTGIDHGLDDVTLKENGKPANAGKTEDKGKPDKGDKGNNGKSNKEK